MTIAISLDPASPVRGDNVKITATGLDGTESIKLCLVDSVGEAHRYCGVPVNGTVSGYFPCSFLCEYTAEVRSVRSKKSPGKLLASYKFTVTT